MGKLIAELNRTFVLRFGESVDVLSFFNEGSGLKSELGIAESAGRAVAEKSAVLQGAAAEFERERIGTSSEIEPADFKDTTRSSLNFAAGRIGGAGQALHFEAAAVSDGVTLGFFH